jgi:hypothetical protein
LKTKRVVWTIVFLSITLAAIVMECIAGLLHPAGTIPWTEYLARYVPWPFQLAAYVILAVWLPFHFWRHDHLRSVAYRNGRADAIVEVAAAKAMSQEWRESPEAYGERAAWTMDVAMMLRGMTAVDPELRKGVVYAADWLDPPHGG